MIDAHHVPPQLQNLLMVVVGNKWPTGDETALRAEAAAWRDAASTISALSDRVAEVRQHVDAGVQGQTRVAIDEFLDALTGPGKGGDGPVLPMIVRCCEDAADALEGLANEIETLRIEIIGALAVLAVQLLVDMTVLFMFGGPAAAAEEITLARLLCWAFLRKAVTRAVTRVTESVVAQVGFALLAQVIELRQHHRRSLDGSELRVAAVNGAVGGAVGFGAGLLGRAFEHGVGMENHLAKLGALGHHAVGAVWQGGFSALTGMAEGAAQDAAFGLSGDWVSGAANGSFNGLWGSRHTAMNPKNLGSISPADHLEGHLDKLLDTRMGVAGPTPGTGRPPSPDTPPPTTPTTPGGPPLPGSFPGRVTGWEGHEVWQDEHGRQHAEVPLPTFGDSMTTFEPGVNPWADHHPGGNRWLDNHPGGNRWLDNHPGGNRWLDNHPGGPSAGSPATSVPEPMTTFDPEGNPWADGAPDHHEELNTGQ